MKGFSGIRTLLVVALLFTMLTVVSGFEPLNETSDFGFLNLNKIDVQVEQIVPITIGEVVFVYSDNLEQVIFSSIYITNNHEITIVTGNWNKDFKNALLYAETINMIKAYTSFEVDNLIMELRTMNSVTYISGLRGGRLRFRSLYKQISSV